MSTLLSMHDINTCETCQRLVTALKNTAANVFKRVSPTEGPQESSKPDMGMEQAINETLNGISQREQDELTARGIELSYIREAMRIVEGELNNFPRRVGGMAGYLLGKEVMGDRSDTGNALSVYLSELVKRKLKSGQVSVYADGEHIILETQNCTIAFNPTGTVNRLVLALKSGFYPELDK